MFKEKAKSKKIESVIRKFETWSNFVKSFTDGSQLTTKISIRRNTKNKACDPFSDSLPYSAPTFS